jgi:hypothetical protein
MLFTNLIKDYFIWHYSSAIKEVFHIWKNFLWFVIHLFSIPQLIKTWASPWKRVHEERTRAWNLEDFVGSLFIGLLSRLVGFLIRTIFILVGSLFFIITIILGFLLILTWFVLPVLPITLIFLGAAILIV